MGKKQKLKPASVSRVEKVLRGFRRFAPSYSRSLSNSGRLLTCGSTFIFVADRGWCLRWCASSFDTLGGMVDGWNCDAAEAAYLLEKARVGGIKKGDAAAFRAWLLAQRREDEERRALCKLADDAARLGFDLVKK